MDEYLSTEQVGWLLGTSDGVVRRMISRGEIDAFRAPGGFRIRRDEALRLARRRIESTTGRHVSDRMLERLAAEVLDRNEQATE